LREDRCAQNPELAKSRSIDIEDVAHGICCGALATAAGLPMGSATARTSLVFERAADHFERRLVNLVRNAEGADAREAGQFSLAKTAMVFAGISVTGGDKFPIAVTKRGTRGKQARRMEGLALAAKFQRGEDLDPQQAVVN